MAESVESGAEPCGDPCAESSAYDLVTMGRIGVDLHPLRTGVPLARVTSFGRPPGGPAADVAVAAVAAARLGRRTAVVTQTGDTPGGALCHGLLAGWDLERVLRHAGAAGALVASRPGAPPPCRPSPRSRRPSRRGRPRERGRGGGRQRLYGAHRREQRGRSA